MTAGIAVSATVRSSALCLGRLRGAALFVAGVVACHALSRSGVAASTECRPGREPDRPPAGSCLLARSIYRDSRGGGTTWPEVPESASTRATLPYFSMSIRKSRA